jgi:uncharacterized protein YecA (UPF0149 family)
MPAVADSDHRDELARRIEVALTPMRGSMPAQQVLGLLTALISAPRNYPHDVWIPFVISGSQIRRGPELDASLTELLRCHELITADLARGLPVGPRDDDAAAAQWCRGYLASASTCREWQADARGRQLLVPFVQLAAFDPADEREARLAALAQGAPEQWLRTELPMLAAGVHAHFEPHRTPELVGVSVAIGRDLPCTCGSRRRYRQCCSLN